MLLNEGSVVLIRHQVVGPIFHMPADSPLRRFPMIWDVFRLPCLHHNFWYLNGQFSHCLLEGFAATCRLRSKSGSDFRSRKDAVDAPNEPNFLTQSDDNSFIMNFEIV